MDLDRVDAEVDLGRDLRVRRRRGVRVVAERAAQRDQHAVLGLRDRQARAVLREEGRVAFGDHRLAERDERLAEAQLVAVLEADAAAHALVIAVRAVRREAIVGDGPRAADLLQLGVGPGDLPIPREAQIGGRPAADRDFLELRLERQDALMALAVAVNEQRPGDALRL